MKKIDQTIKELIKKVSEKEIEIAKGEKPNFITECIIELGGKSNNLHKIQCEEEVIKTLSILYSMKASWDESVKLLGLEKEFTHNGYSFNDWVEDLRTVVNKINLNKRKDELITLKNRLDVIISPELKAQMEVEDIQKELDK